MRRWWVALSIVTGAEIAYAVGDLAAGLGYISGVTVVTFIVWVRLR